jgi:hypothetical protein
MHIPVVLAAVIATAYARAAPYPQIPGLTFPVPLPAGDVYGLPAAQQLVPLSDGEGPDEGARGGSPMATGPMGVATPLPVAAPNPGAGAAANGTATNGTLATPAATNGTLTTGTLTNGTAINGTTTNAGNNTRCAADVDRLASGIQQNILDQQGEQVSVQAIMNLMQTNGTVDMGQFMTMKAQLLSFVTAGISLRVNNQEIAPPGNAALPGLGKVCGVVT